MNIYSISLLLAWSSNLIIGFLVFFKNPKNRVNQSFFFLSVILTFWLLGCFGETVTSYKTTALFWDRVLYTGVCLYPLLYLNFLSNILQLKVRKSVIRSIAAVCFIFLLFNYIPFLRTYLISTVERRFPFRFIAVPNLFWFVLVGFVMTIGTYGVFLKFRVYKKASSEKRNQMKYLFIAYAILTTGGGMYFLLPLNINVPPIDSTMVVIFSIIMAVAILKYRLMDIRVVITRTGIFIAVYAAVLGIPFAAATWYQGLLIK
ncbi:MAG: hypothetical protein KKA52_07385, partial [Candidatus Omnitrophica bacterium]|nr:hypothetical protein [Candidatus Omnitrophota bacterium]